jgi:hypothetical protein
MKEDNMSKKSRKEVEAILSGMGVFTAIISFLVELVKKFGGTMEDIYRLATPEGSETLEKIARLIVGGAEKVKNEFLKLISGGEKLELDAVDGSETIPGSNDMFKAGIDSDFVSWGANQKGRATGKTPVDVHEMTKNATFSQLFGSLASDVRKCCFTQHQIKNFIRKYRNWLREDGYATFFLFESNGNFFVAGVSIGSGDGLDVIVLGFERGDVWYAEGRHRIVVPQLAVSQ